MSGTSAGLPLFPLHAVLCPGIALPIHVFEPRYRLLAERCLRDSAPFGIVLIREGREVGGGPLSIAGVGTFAEIRRAEELPDGRFELLVVGSGRFGIEDVDTDTEPYLVARVVPLPDVVGDEERAGLLADGAIRRFVDYLRLLQPGPGETAEAINVRIEVETEDVEPGEAEGGSPDPSVRRQLVIPDDPTTLSYLLSGIVQVPLLRRQELLEAETTEDRLVGLHAALDVELWMLARRLRLYAPDPTVVAGRPN